jgi:hypothetical protein
MKWFVIMTYLNVGLVLICFSQMAALNQCNTHLQHTFFYCGAIGVGIAALITIVSVFVAAVEFIQKRRNARRSYANAS